MTATLSVEAVQLQVDGAADDRAGEPGRLARRGRVRRHRRRGLVGGRADVAGRVLGGDLVEVVAAVSSCRRSSLSPAARSGSRARRRKAGAGRAMNVVARHPDVVRRRRPRERRAPNRPHRTSEPGADGAGESPTAPVRGRVMSAWISACGRGHGCRPEPRRSGRRTTPARSRCRRIRSRPVEVAIEPVARSVAACAPFT